jgi:hypothetical protein
LHDAAGALEKELALPATFEAKVEICLVTWVLSQFGQVTSPTAAELNTSSSNGVPHSWHKNSKIGIQFS